MSTPSTRTRSTSKIVTFESPFKLRDFDEVLPAGSYLIDTDEDLLPGLSFPAYIRILTTIHMPAKSGNPMLARTMPIDPGELEAALARDRQFSRAQVGPGTAPGGRAQPNSSTVLSPAPGELCAAENEGMRTRAS